MGIPQVVYNRPVRRFRGAITVGWFVASTIVILLAIGGGYALLVYLRPSVSVTDVVEAPVVQAFYATGTIQPVREYPIKANLQGLLTAVLVDKGVHVTKGQPLATVTDPKLQFAFDKAQAELKEKQQRAADDTSPVLAELDAQIKGSQSMLEIAQRELSRLTVLAQNNASAQNDLDQADDRVKSLGMNVGAMTAQRASKKLELQREVDVAKAAVAAAEWDLKQQTLVSPIDGVVLDRPIAVGTHLAENDPVLRIADVRPSVLVMRADVDEEDVAKVNFGQDVKMVLYAFGDSVITGKVQKIYDQADPNRRTFEIDVAVDNPSDRLQPGMTGELAFITAHKDVATVVPSQAVQGGAVYTVKDHRVERHAVQVGLRSIERVEIVSGVGLNERVIITPATTLQNGQTVRETFIDPGVAAGLNKPPPMTEAFKAFGH